MTKTSILVRSVVVVLAALAWSDAESVAYAQDGGSASAAGPAVFNPFASFSLNRFAFNNLGFLQVGDASPVAASAGGSGGEVAEAVVVRPPYRPPVRSPYRPPPRPPF
jgi:hypothetical protein